jgi:hypothetical protein
MKAIYRIIIAFCIATFVSCYFQKFGTTKLLSNHIQQEKSQNILRGRLYENVTFIFFIQLR